MWVARASFSTCFGRMRPSLSQLRMRAGEVPIRFASVSTSSRARSRDFRTQRDEEMRIPSPRPPVPSLG